MRRTLLATIGLLALGSVAHADPIKIVTENYPPFSYREGETFKGASIDQADMIMKSAGIDYSIEMVPWARAVMLAETQPSYCLLTTAHTAERDKKFKWVEPILTDRMMLVRSAGSKIDPASLAAARKYIVGTQRDDFTIGVLKANKFTSIDLAPDFDLTLSKLLRGRVDLMPMSLMTFESLRDKGVKIETTVLLTEQYYAIACHKSVPDADIAKMQASLDKMIFDGRQTAIFAKYGLLKGDQ